MSSLSLYLFACTPAIPLKRRPNIACCTSDAGVLKTQPSGTFCISCGSQHLPAAGICKYLEMHSKHVGAGHAMFDTLRKNFFTCQKARTSTSKQAACHGLLLLLSQSSCTSASKCSACCAVARLLVSLGTFPACICSIVHHFPWNVHPSWWLLRGRGAVHDFYHPSA